MAQRSTHERHGSHTDVMEQAPKKRIIVCCDGTWQDSDSSATTPSNVTRIHRAILPVGIDYSSGRPRPIQQVVFYQNGIGTGGAGLYQKYIGSKISGATGEGIIFNIREAYVFVCHNYVPGDEIVLIGFSRGAFTARTISSLIKQLGLLTTAGMTYLVEIIDDWEYQLNTTRKTPYPDKPWEDRPPFTDMAYQDGLHKRKLTRRNIPVKCVAVWDTVGSLGVPSTALALTLHRWLSRILPKAVVQYFRTPREFAFVDTAVLDNIEYAFHSLGLDEKRESFTPTMWYKKEGQVLPKVLKQTWFPGVHSDIGGSYDNDDIPNITLAWMIGQMETYKILNFNRDYVLGLIQQTIKEHERVGAASITKIGDRNDARAQTFGPLREWGLGKIHDSYTTFFRLGGALTRTPKEYRETTRDEGTTDRILKHTHETVHASVRVRMALGGLGMNDQGTYKSNALANWSYAWKELSNPDTPHALSQPGEAGRLKGVYWEKLMPKDGKLTKIAQMMEDDMTEFERVVLRHWTAADNDWEATADRREHIVDFARSKDRESPMSERRYWENDREEDLPSIAEHDDEHGHYVAERNGDPKHLHITTDVQKAEVGHTPREQIQLPLA